MWLAATFCVKLYVQQRHKTVFTCSLIRVNFHRTAERLIVSVWGNQWDISVGFNDTDQVIGPILWVHSGPLCHALSLLSLWTSILHCHSPRVVTVAHRLRYSYSWLQLILVVVSPVATPGEWQCKIRTGGVRRLAVANGPNIFQMLFVYFTVDTVPVSFWYRRHNDGNDTAPVLRIDGQRCKKLWA